MFFLEEIILFVVFDQDMKPSILRQICWNNGDFASTSQDLLLQFFAPLQGICMSTL